MASLAILVLPFILAIFLAFIVYNVIMLILGIISLVLLIKSKKENKKSKSLIACGTIFLFLLYYSIIFWTYVFFPEIFIRPLEEIEYGKEVVAVRYQEYETVEKLLEDGWNPNDNPEIFEEFFTLEDNMEVDWEILELLLQNGYNPNTMLEKELNVLEYAIREDGYKAAMMLIEYGADVNFDEEQAPTAIHALLLYGINEDTYSLIQTILDSDIDLEVEDTEGRTALEYLDIENEEKKGYNTEEEYMKIKEIIEKYQEKEN